MPYGIVKVDQITFTNAGVDQTISVSGIVASISGNITATGTISGNVIRGGTLVSGATVTGTAGQFGTITGNTAAFTTVTGTTVTGTTANFVTVSGTTVTGATAQFTTVTGGTAGFTTVTGTTVTGTTANFVTVSGTTVTGNVGNFTTVTGGSAGFTTVTGTTITGTTLTVASGTFTGNSTAAAFIPTGSTVPTNGVYLPSANNVAISTNGAGRLFVDSSGRVGVGISAPDTNLTVRGAGASIAGVNSHFLLSDSTTAGSGVGGSILFEGNYTSGGAKAVYAGIAGIKENATDSNYAGSLRFYSRANGSLPALAMTIDSSQRVGIGTSTPGDLLTLNSTVGYPLATFNDSGTFRGQIGYTFDYGYFHVTSASNLAFRANGSERARIDSSGRLLVGTSTARTNFFNTAWTPQIQSENATDQSTALSLVCSANNSNQGLIILGNNRGSVGSNAIVQNADGIGLISFQGNDGSEMVEGARIQAVVDGTPGANDLPTRLEFSTTADGASSPTERMRITNSGNIIFPAGTTGLAFANNETAIYNDGGFGQGIRFGNTYGAGKGYCLFTTNGTTVGQITANGTTATSYLTTSDYRLKENVAAIVGGIARFKQLKPSRFNFISEPDRTVDGFLAHEVQAVVPEAIHGEKDAVDDDGNPIYQGIDQSKLVPLLTAALQEAVAKIESLEARLTAAGI